MRNCDGLLVSSPVYARGYPGSLKNALDWLVSTDAFVEKPFALLNASTRSLEVQDSLITVIETMSGVHVHRATSAFNLPSTHASVSDIVNDQALAQALTTALANFIDHFQIKTSNAQERNRP